MILQILAGGVAAIAVTAKLYWNKVLRLLHIRKDEEDTSPATKTEAGSSSDTV
jgi:hypothetical protein